MGHIFFLCFSLLFAFTEEEACQKELQKIDQEMSKLNQEKQKHLDFSIQYRGNCKTRELMKIALFSCFTAPDLGPTLSSMCPNVKLKGTSDPEKQLKIIDFSEPGSFATPSTNNKTAPTDHFAWGKASEERKKAINLQLQIDELTELHR